MREGDTIGLWDAVAATLFGRRRRGKDDDRHNAALHG